MENKTLQIEITKEDEKNDVVISMKKKMESMHVSSDDKCCIYKVPEFMLKGREYFYQPHAMSIGPVFYKEPKLETMQELKWICLNSFLQHPDNARPNLEHYIEFVREKEAKIRGCYEHQSGLCSDEFAEMIVLDAAFLVYIFMVFGSTTLQFHVHKIKNKLLVSFIYSKVDVFRLENQIPYFVLKGVYTIAFGNKYQPNTFINATLMFIGRGGTGGILGLKTIKSIIDGHKITDDESNNIQHLVDLQRMCCLHSMTTPLLLNQPNTNTQTSSVSYLHKLVSSICPSSLCNWLHQHQGRHLKVLTDDVYSNRLSYTAKQLKDAGVTFVAIESDSPLDITFSKGKLQIPRLDIFDDTEIYLRNLVYFEQCHYCLGDTYFIDYIFFLDELIDTVQDVQVLVKYKILRNHLGSDEDVVNLFNNIGKNVPVSYKVYSNVSIALNCYASTRCNQWMAILRSRYFNHPWAIISVFAAFLLLVLTIVQTAAAFIK